MKRTLAISFVLAMLLLALAGCGEKKGNRDNGGANSATPGAESGNVANDELPGDDMTGNNEADSSVTGDGMMGDAMDGTVSSANRRGNYAARANNRSRSGDDGVITHENGNLYGKAYLTPETERSANAQLRSNGRSMTGIPVTGLDANDLRYRQMLSNGRVHDTDGFLFDGENTHYNTLR